MRRLCLLPLVLLVSAAPAAGPATDERLIVHVRAAELPAGTPTQPPNDPAILKDAKERSSLQVTTQPGRPFEAIAVVNGVTYRLAGRAVLRDGDGNGPAIPPLPSDSDLDVLREGAILVREDQNVVAEHDENVADFLTIPPAGCVLVAEYRCVAP